MKQKHLRSAAQQPQLARARITIGGFSADAQVAVTPAGLLAIGGLVSLVLFSVAPIILSAAAARRARSLAPPGPSEEPPRLPLLPHEG